MLAARREAARGILAIGAATALMAAVVSTVGPSASAAQKKITLTEQDYYGSQPALGGWNKIIAEFEKAYPNIAIKRTIVPQPTYITDVLNEASSGSLPDVLMLDNPYIPQVAGTGLLTPLKSIGSLNTSQISASELYDGIYRGKLYGLPLYTNTNALFYNKTMFARAHLSPPKTWAQLISDAKALTTSSVYGFVTDLSPGSDAGFWDFSPFLWTSAGANATAHIASPASVAALKLFVTLERQGSLPKASVTWDGTQADELFDTSKAAMVESGSWTISTKLGTKGLNFGVTELPTPTGHQTLLVPTGGETWTIPRTNPTEERAALDFLRFLTRPNIDVQEAVYQGGLVPTVKSAVKPALAQENPTDMAPFASELIAGGTPRTKYLGTAFNAVATSVTNAIDAAVAGQASAQQAFSSIESQVNAELSAAGQK